MSKSTSLFLILTILSSVFSSQVSISSLESSKLGRNLLSMASIHLSSNEPVSTLLSLLNEMADTLRADQEKADTAHAEYQGQCEADITFYTNEISDSQKRIDSAVAQLATLRPQLATDEQSLVDARSNLADLESQLHQATKVRNDEAAEFAIKVVEHENTLATLHEVAGLFQKLVQPAGTPPAIFLENKQNIFAQVGSLIRSKISSVRKGYQGIFKVLAGIVEKAPVQSNQDMVTKILNLIAKIRDNVEASYQAEKTAEGDRKSAFEKLEANLNEDITHTNSNINNLVNNIATLQISIASQEAEEKAQNERNSETKNQLNDRERSCKDENDSYSTDRENR